MMHYALRRVVLAGVGVTLLAGSDPRSAGMVLVRRAMALLLLRTECTDVLEDTEVFLMSKKGVPSSGRGICYVEKGYFQQWDGYFLPHGEAFIQWAAVISIVNLHELRFDPRQPMRFFRLDPRQG